MLGGVSKQFTQVVAWVVAVVVAVGVGLTAVDLVGASVRGRGPLGSQVDRDADRVESRAKVDPNASRVEDAFQGNYGTLRVACQGVFAIAVKAQPNSARGWEVVSYEPGPDDDVDAVFRNGQRSVELEVFCNSGRPTIAEIERKRLPPDGPLDD